MTSKHETKGQRRLVVSPESLEAIFTTGAEIKSNLPTDARFVGHWRDERGCHVFLFESDEWEPGEEAELIPESEIDVDALSE